MKLDSGNPRSDFEPRTNVISFCAYGNDYPSHQPYTNTGITSYINTRTTSSDPKWRWKIAHGINAAQPYSLDIVNDVQYMTCSGFSRLKGSVLYDSNGISSYCPPQYAVGITSDGDTYNTAVSRLRKKLVKDTGYFNSWVPIGELKEFKQTVGGALSLTTNMVSGLVALKRGNLKDAYSRASDVWLSFNFGIKPMLNDMQSISESIRKQLGHTQPNRVYRASASRSFTGTPTSTFSGLVSSGCNVFAKYYTTTDVRTSLTVGVKTAIQNYVDYGAAERFALPPSNLIPAFWELVPYSWVIDYFLPIGDMLEDQFSSTPSVLYSTRSTKCTIKTEFSGAYVGPRSTSFEGYGNASSGYIQEVLFNRVLNGAQFPIRNLTLRTYDNISSHAFAKLANLTAVLAPRNRGVYYGRNLHSINIF